MRLPFPSMRVNAISSFTSRPHVTNLLKKAFHHTAFPLSPTQLNNLLNLAAETKNLQHATQIHTQIITNNYFSFPFLFNNLLNLYAKCGYIDQSLILFSNTLDESKNVITWSSLITQLVRFNQPFRALSFFSQMKCSAVCPNEFTYSAAVAACAEAGVLVHGKQIHCLVMKCGHESNVFVGSALVVMYGKCCDMGSAQKVFNEMPVRDIVSFNSIIVGYLENEFYDGAIEVFREVVRGEISGPNERSCSSVLSACANISDLKFGKQAHGIVIKCGLANLEYVTNSLMDMYCKCGSFEDAVKIFRTIGGRDVVSWNVMMIGCVHNEYFGEACEYFWKMRSEGISADEASFSTVLHASASLVSLDQGSLVHDQIIKSGFSGNTRVASSLIAMYAKCGRLGDSYRVFEDTENRDVLCWTAMISAFQQHGCSKEALELFEEMLGEGIEPCYITFVSLLSACSHSGRVEEGFSYFNSMTKLHHLIPRLEHYACMVDLLGRAGRLDEAKKFVETMPIEPNSRVWGALLGACRNYGNLEIGRKAAQRLFELEPNNSGNYMLLCDMYMRDGMLKEADEVRRLMGTNSIRKEAGRSRIDLRDTIFVN